MALDSDARRTTPAASPKQLEFVGGGMLTQRGASCTSCLAPQCSCRLLHHQAAAGCCQGVCFYFAFRVQGHTISCRDTANGACSRGGGSGKGSVRGRRVCVMQLLAVCCEILCRQNQVIQAPFNPPLNHDPLMVCTVLSKHGGRTLLPVLGVPANKLWLHN